MNTNHGDMQDAPMPRPRRLFLTALLLALAPLAGTLLADVDEEDLRRGSKPEPEASLDGGQGEFEKDIARQGKENLDKIRELLEKVQDDFAARKTGGETQKRQKQAVGRLEKLIEQVIKASQQQQSSSSSSSQQQKKQQEQQQKQQSEKQRQREQKKQQENQRQQREQQEQQEQERNDQQPEQQEQRKPGQPQGSDGKGLSDRLKRSGRWGVLPRKVTEALSASEKEAPARYREIIARYYRKMGAYYERSDSR